MMESLSSASSVMATSGTAKSAFRGGLGSIQLRCPMHIQPTNCRFVQRIHATSVSAPEKASSEQPQQHAEAKGKLNQLAPNAFEVQSLLMEVCDETSIAELELKVGAFKLHMKRDVGKLKETTPSAPIAPPVPSKPMVQSETSVPTASAPVVTPPAPKAPLISTATLLATPASKPGSRFGLLEAAADEGLLFVTSPKVGLFRRSRVVKKKSGRPLCEEGQVIKEGQVVCYVEQLGTQQPVEAENSGEVVKILWKDGESVGYGDPLIAIRPSFPGIK